VRRDICCPVTAWHWSYRDRYWAFQTGHGTALYGPRLHAARQAPAQTAGSTETDSCTTSQ